MTDVQKGILIALGLLLALCAVVSLTLRHYIGGFLEQVAREEEESEDEAAARDDPPAARQENEP